MDVLKLKERRERIGELRTRLAAARETHPQLSAEEIARRWVEGEPDYFGHDDVEGALNAAELGLEQAEGLSGAAADDCATQAGLTIQLASEHLDRLTGAR